jgi:hypothetical protein
MRVIIIRIGIVALVALAVLQGVMAGRDVGHRKGEPSPLDRVSAQAPRSGT